MCKQTHHPSENLRRRFGMPLVVRVQIVRQGILSASEDLHQSYDLMTIRKLYSGLIWEKNESPLYLPENVDVVVIVDVDPFVSCLHDVVSKEEDRPNYFLYPFDDSYASPTMTPKIGPSIDSTSNDQIHPSLQNQLHLDDEAILLVRVLQRAPRFHLHHH